MRPNISKLILTFCIAIVISATQFNTSAQYYYAADSVASAPSNYLADHPMVKEAIQTIENSKSILLNQSPLFIDIICSLNGTILDTKYIVKTASSMTSEDIIGPIRKTFYANQQNKTYFQQLRDAGLTGLSYTYCTPNSSYMISGTLYLDELIANFPGEESASFESNSMVKKAISTITTFKPITVKHGFKKASVSTSGTNLKFNTTVSSSTSLSQLNMNTLKGSILKRIKQRSSFTQLLPQLKEEGITGITFKFTAPKTSNSKWVFIHIDELISGNVDIDYAYDNGKQTKVDPNLKNNYLISTTLQSFENTRSAMLKMPGIVGYDVELKNNKFVIKTTINSESTYETTLNSSNKSSIIKQLRANDIGVMAYGYWKEAGITGITYQYVLQNSSKEITIDLHIYELISGIIVD